jgi:hypothetical protein
VAGESPLDQLFDALAKRHHFEPPREGSWPGQFVPATLLAFSARFGGGRLFDGELMMLVPRPPSSARRLGVPLLTTSEGGISLIVQQGVHFATLRDGRRIVVTEERVREGPRWFRVNTS